MEKLRHYVGEYRRQLVVGAAIALALAGLLWWRLGSLTAGLSPTEHTTAITPVGWHGMYHQPLYLPLELVRSVLFVVVGHHGLLLTRLPNTLFGALAIISFGLLLRRWHGGRTAVFATALFATGAWTLHVSRLASFDVLYLSVLPTLLLAQLLFQRHYNQAWLFYGLMLYWGMLLYVPGLVWVVLLSIWWQRQAIVQGWQHFNLWWQRSLYALAGFIWLPLLAIDLHRSGVWRTWLGLPAHLAAPLTLLKHFVGVFVHLFVRGPAYPELWLGRVPLLDLLTK